MASSESEAHKDLCFAYPLLFFTPCPSLSTTLQFPPSFRSSCVGIKNGRHNDCSVPMICSQRGYVPILHPGPAVKLSPPKTGFWSSPWRGEPKRMRIRPWMMSLVLENVDFSWWLWNNPGISWSNIMNACKPPPSAGPRPKPPFRQVQVSFEPARLDPPHKLLKWRKAVGRELCHSVTKLWCIAPAPPTSQSVSRGPSPRRSPTPSVPCGRPAPPRSR